jgi:biotin carboxyl carrier protein
VSHDVRFDRSDAGALDVAFDGKVFTAVVAAGQKASRDRSDGVVGVTIHAPMPGRILRVLVAVGERVTAQQAVIIVEAMKMENELRSPKDGVVKEVAVTAGAAVDAGTVLVVIE